MSRELVVLSHLRWTFVWQRPQHLISRLSTYFDRVFFVEEPIGVEGLQEPALRLEDVDHVTRVWLDLPAQWQCGGFDTTASDSYAAVLGDVLDEGAERMVWLYTPMGLDVARSLRPSLLVYDVMDDLASFKFAPPTLALRQRQALREADVVFCGGRSLHQSVIEHRPSGTHCFPSGVEPEHFARAINVRAQRPLGGRRVAGYVGVIDERIDLDLIGRLAAELPDWEIRMVGPIAKIDRSTLPQAANITYPGCQPYAELPLVMAAFDVALMPFAAKRGDPVDQPDQDAGVPGRRLTGRQHARARRGGRLRRRGRDPRGRWRLRPGLPSGLRRVASRPL